jgi:hypothetical protein
VFPSNNLYIDSFNKNENKRKTLYPLCKPFGMYVCCTKNITLQPFYYNIQSIAFNRLTIIANLKFLVCPLFAFELVVMAEDQHDIGLGFRHHPFRCHVIHTQFDARQLPITIR